MNLMKMKSFSEYVLTYAVSLCLLLSGCSGLPPHASDSVAEDVCIVIRTDGCPTRSSDPEENLVTDLNLFIFNEDGLLEERLYIADAGDAAGEGGHIHETTLLKGCRYSIYACANIGYRLEAGTIQDLENYRYYLVYPDDYRTGIPMCGKKELVSVAADGIIDVTLERLMAKVSVRIDRSRLSDDVEFHVRKISVGGCPKSACLFGQSRAESKDDIFLRGFDKSDDGVAALNSDEAFGRSGKVSVYLLENMQGDLLPEDTEDDGKILEEGDPAAKVCSYIEIEADYLSSSHYTLPGQSLIYRFYIGDGNGNFDVRRNRHYNICITPDGDGLSEDSWRVDQSGIGSLVAGISLSQDTLEMSYYGETTDIECSISPENATDRTLVWESDNRAVADVSQSGTVTATGEGSCRISCSAADGSGVRAECLVNVRFKPNYMRIYPGNYVRGKIGEEVHIRCEYFPPTASFDIGTEELEYDRERGIYDYVIDDDGNGVRLHLKGKGSGMLYFETGYPVSQSEMIVVVVD